MYLWELPYINDMRIIAAFKAFVLSAVLLAVLSVAASAHPVHPRIIYDEQDFEALAKVLESGDNQVINRLHECIMMAADAAVADESVLKYEKDASNRRILHVSRSAIKRLVPCSYAYRMTGNKKYLRKVRYDLQAVCAFPDWNHSHFLDVAEMATGVSIAYDWLYDSLDKKLREKVLKTICDYAIEPSFLMENDKPWWFFTTANNWNQVCNGGLVLAALAIYDKYPERAQEVIDRAVQTNSKVLGKMYAPDGAYPEGPGYWAYGTIYEVLMLTALEKEFGTDYDLSSAPGFMKTDLFKIHSAGPTGKMFNFADNGTTCRSNVSLWYFAAKKNDPNLLFSELKLMKSDRYATTGECGFLPLAIKHALSLDLKEPKSPKSRFYAAQGEIPVMMCRSSWSSGKAHYLGIKGGRASYNHGHMDAGMFLYDAYGVRWAMDYERQAYATVENGIKALGGRLIKGHQESLRWRLFRLNCRQHNTLTVNDKDHDVTAVVKMTATEDTKARKSATFDMTPLFFGDLVKAERTAALCNDDHVEITDVLAAPSDRPAHVRWTMVSEAKPSLTPEGIVLEKKGVKMLLKAEGADVRYMIWSSDPQAYDSPLRHLDAPNPNTYICGYEVDVPASAEYTIRVSMNKVQ